LVVPYTALPPEYHSSLPLRDALPIYSVDKSATYGRSDGTIGVRASLDPQRRQCRQRAPGAIAGGRAEPLAAGVDPAPRGAVALVRTAQAARRRGRLRRRIPRGTGCAAGAGDRLRSPGGAGHAAAARARCESR